MISDKELLDLALKQKENAYAPYSGFKVGSALLTEDNKVFLGSNVENASFGATSCAERNAVFNAVSNGSLKIKTIAIASDSKDFIYPCGICRQVISEFSSKNTRIICSNSSGYFEVYNPEELLPKAFGEKEKLNGF